MHIGLGKMKLKFINTLNGHYQMKKRLYRVYATYNYLGEVFFCVKARKFNYDTRYGKWKYVSKNRNENFYPVWKK